MKSITLTADEVRALASTGRVTVRRPAAVPECDVPGAYFDAYNGGPQWNWWDSQNRVCNGHGMITCPYGHPGDVLAVHVPRYYWVGPGPTLATVAVVRGDGGDRAWEWEMVLEAPKC